MKLYEYCMPNECIDNVRNIDYRGLYLDGYRLLLFDLDNTLAPYSMLTPDKELRFFIEHLKSLGFDVAIVSNSKMPRVKPFADAFGVEAVAPALKPTKKTLRKIDEIDPNLTVFIGDQLMTDMIFANRIGFYSILVDPIKQKEDKWMTRINRKLEHKMIEQIKQQESEFYESVLKRRYE